LIEFLVVLLAYLVCGYYLFGNMLHHSKMRNYPKSVFNLFLTVVTTVLFIVYLVSLLF